MNITDIKTEQLLVDPVNFRAQSKYRLNGLTVMSNDPSVMTRDDRGNIVLQESGSDNQMLIVETVRKLVQKRSFLDAVDTNFEYFSFPAKIKPTAAAVNLDINIDQDVIYARYKPSENRTIPTGAVFSGILMDEIEDGLPQKNTNTYYITKAIKNSGADLRFRININHRYDAPNWDSASSTVAFTIMKQGPKYPLNRTYLGQYSRSGEDGDWSVITPYEVWDTFIDVTIPNSEFEIGDMFSIGALAGIEGNSFYHTINSEQTYWVITDAGKNVDEWNQPIE